MKKTIVFVFAALGLALTLLIIIGAAIDITSFDRTRGGYEPPYTGYTGQPIDWDESDVTKTGVVRRGSPWLCPSHLVQLHERYDKC